MSIKEIVSKALNFTVTHRFGVFSTIALGVAAAPVVLPVVTPAVLGGITLANLSGFGLLCMKQKKFQCETIPQKLLTTVASPAIGVLFLVDRISEIPFNLVVEKTYKVSELFQWSVLVVSTWLILPEIALGAIMMTLILLILGMYREVKSSEYPSEFQEIFEPEASTSMS